MYDDEIGYDDCVCMSCGKTLRTAREIIFGICLDCMSGADSND